MRTKILSLSLAIVLLSSGFAFSRTTRDLVFEDEEPVANQAPANSEVAGKQSIAVKTTVVLERDGKTSTVLPSHEFKSGDKVKLVFTPSVDGYVYWMAKGSSGQYQVLFPNAKAGTDNQVKRNQEYTVPIKGGFRFDNTPGSEELLCILSTERLNDLDSAAAEQFKGAAAKQLSSLEEKHAAKRTTRDLVFEEEESEDVSTKKQEAPKGEPFVASYTLKHI